MKKIIYVTCMFVVCITCMLSCQKKSQDYVSYLNNPQLFSQTVYELNHVVMGNNFTPIVASRNYTYAAIAAYEVIAHSYPQEYQSLAGQIHDLEATPALDDMQKINIPLAALLAYIEVGEMVTFPEGSMQQYRDSILQTAIDKGLPEDIKNKSIEYAKSVAAAIIKWSKKDHYLETRSAEKYVIKDEPGRWIPTPPMYAQAVEPHWKTIRTLVLDSAGQFPVPPPLPFNVTNKKSPFYQETIKIKKAIENLTDEQKHIAYFWDDNPFKMNVVGHVSFATKKFSPPGHWMSVVGIAAEKKKSDFKETVAAYTLTSIAIFDAFIHSWNAKFLYNTARPETIINKYIDDQWRPLLQAPSFPEYTCGHSTISSAAAEALTKTFGDNFKYTDTTELEFGIASRSFQSFREAAIENNYARFYGGIHFHSSCLVSTEAGKNVGQYVVQKLTLKK